MYDDYKHHSQGQDWSYTLAPLMTDPNKAEKESRHTNDSSTRRNIAFSYENYDSNFLWDAMKITYSQQKITQRARTDEYCDGGEYCESVRNPLGLQFKNGDIVDKDGNKLVFQEVDKPDGSGKKTVAIVDKQGNKFYSDTWDTKGSTKGKIWLDCQSLDCNGSLTYYHITGTEWSGYGYKGKQAVDLNKPETILETTDENGKKTKVVFDVIDHKNDRHHYKEVKVKQTSWLNKGEAWDDPNYEGWEADKYNKWAEQITGYSEADSWQLIQPPSAGYSTNMWTDRKLNSDLKQINLDFTKFFRLGNIDNELSYNIAFAKMDKQMINRSGYGPQNIQWWAKYFDTLDKNGNPACTSGGTCTIPYEEKPTTFLIPVETTTRSFAIKDSIRFHPRVHFDVSYRYDHINHKPHFNRHTDPALPDGLLRGMYIKQQSMIEPELPKWYDKNKFSKCTTSGCKKNGQYEDPAFEQAMKKYESDLDDYHNNPQKNIDYLISRKRKFSHSSYGLTGTFDPLDFIRLQLKYSTGFRAPTSDELYFTFKHPDFSILANPDLKPELAKTKEVALTFHHQRSFITFGGFETDYTNFIQLAFKGYKQFTDKNGNTNGLPYRTYQNVNNSKAWVRGLSVSSYLDFESIIQKMAGFGIGYKLEYQKGRTYGIDEVEGEQRKIWYPINEISPMKQVFNVSYHHPDGRYGLDMYFTHMSAKKAKDSYNPYHSADQAVIKDENYNPNDISAKYLSKTYNIFDLIGYYKPSKPLTLQLGLYNIFNKQYATWESLRTIRQFGTSNMICKTENPTIGCFSKNQGIERFYAPGRNLKFNITMAF